LSQEDEENTDLEAFADAEYEAGRAIMISLVHSLQIEQSKAQLYFMLIPLAFSVGLLLGYYISFTNL
jgi:hypothetical protein